MSVRSVGTSEAHKMLFFFAKLLSRDFDCDSTFRLIPKGGVETIPARSTFIAKRMLAVWLKEKGCGAHVSYHTGA
eukprot:2482678-Amphidinium_carterae.1